MVFVKRFDWDATNRRVCCVKLGMATKAKNDAEAVEERKKPRREKNWLSYVPLSIFLPFSLGCCRCCCIVDWHDHFESRANQGIAARVPQSNQSSRSGQIRYGVRGQKERFRGT